jgi:hypothetical protein
VEETVKDFEEAVEVEVGGIVKDFEVVAVVEIVEDSEVVAEAGVEEIVKKEVVSEGQGEFQEEISEEVIVEIVEVTGVVVEAGLIQTEVRLEVLVGEEVQLPLKVEEIVHCKQLPQAKKKNFTRKNLKSSWVCRYMLHSRRLQLL